MTFIKELEAAFLEKKNAENAFHMEKYMKNHFVFFGIKTGERRTILKAISLKNKEEIMENSRKIALELFSKKEREYHYCAIEIIIKNLKNSYIKNDIQLINKLLTTNSWWDSVDTISKYILGEYILQFSEQTIPVIEQFSNSDNMWLNRSALLFQLGYKKKTNADILFSECTRHSNSNEFFIQKAIGWSLREYGKTNPKAIKTFVSKIKLKRLSEKEALKNIS